MDVRSTTCCNPNTDSAESTRYQWMFEVRPAATRIQTVQSVLDINGCSKYDLLQPEYRQCRVYWISMDVRSTTCCNTNTDSAESTGYQWMFEVRPAATRTQTVQSLLDINGCSKYDLLQHEHRQCRVY